MDLAQQEFKIYTYCTDTSHPMFKKLTSALDIEILPILSQWTWDFYPKSQSVYETLKVLDDETVVLICDSYDVLPIKGLTNKKLFSKIIEHFDLDKITFNAEKNCYPNRNLEKLYPNVDSSWKFLNAGLYVGKVKNIVKMLEVSLEKIKGRMDQEIFSLCYVNNEFNIDIDYDCKVFQTLYMLGDGDLTINDGKIINNKTGHLPILIHGNGKSSLKNFLEYVK